MHSQCTHHVIGFCHIGLWGCVKLVWSEAVNQCPHCVSLQLHLYIYINGMLKVERGLRGASTTALRGGSSGSVTRIHVQCVPPPAPPTYPQFGSWFSVAVQGQRVLRCYRNVYEGEQSLQKECSRDWWRLIPNYLMLWRRRLSSCVFFTRANDCLLRYAVEGRRRK